MVTSPPVRPMAVSRESGKARLDVAAQHKPVHHNLYGVLAVLFQHNFFIQFVKVSVHTHARKAAAARGLKFLLLGAFAPAHHWGKHLKPCALGSFKISSTIWSTVCWLIGRPHTGSEARRCAHTEGEDNRKFR